MEQITPAQAKPVRRRRRWLIVALLLVLVSMVSWWYYPRGDARFVGKWAMSDQSTPNEHGALILLSSGLAHWSIPGSPGSISFPWRVDGQHLIFGNESEGPLTHTIQTVSDWVYKFTSHEFAYGDGEEPYRVIGISATEIVIEDPDNRTRMTLRRIPE